MVAPNLTEPITASLLSEERARLVRLCARLSGDPDAAEDLAQETLGEAWRSRHTLRDPARRAQWLTGIARNVCRRWARQQYRGAAIHLRLLPADIPNVPATAREPADDFDIETEIERAELATLLDRALALLPPTTRAALIARYITQSPHAEIAAQLGMSEGAVKVRIQRGRLALRRVLMTDFPAEAATFGLAGTGTDRCAETRIWCPACGQCHLIGRFTSGGPNAELMLRCPVCNRDDEPGYVISNANHGDASRILSSVKGVKPALTRTQTWVHAYFREALAHDAVACPHCGHRNPLQIGIPPPSTPWPHQDWRFRVRCTRCDWFFTLSFAGSVFALPQTQQFWRAHPRMRMLPAYTVEAEGHAATVTRIESVTDGAYLDVMIARDTYAVLGIHGSGRA